VKNCIRVFGFLLQDFDGFGGGQDKQSDLMVLGLALDFTHHGQLPVRTTTDDKLTAFPWNVFLNRKRSVAEPLLEFLGWLLLALANLAAINDDIVSVNGAVDLDGANEKRPNCIRHCFRHCLGALLRRESSEGGPTLLDFLAAAVRAEDFPFFVIDQR